MLSPIFAKPADYRKMSSGDANKNEARFPKTCAIAGAIRRFRRLKVRIERRRNSTFSLPLLASAISAAISIAPDGRRRPQ
jgi:hypothetical protein